MNISKKYEPTIGILGNIFEWYNFALFMPFLPVISKQFFPAGSELCGHTITFLVMSMGLFMRPFGSDVFGPIGDKFGRSKAISLSILLMAFSTFGMAILPGYNSIGIAAPILLIIFRGMQGISMGGEYTSAMVHLVEKAPSNHRGFFGSWSDAGSQIGVLLCGQSLILLYSFFSNDQVYQFAWRIPFLCSLVLVPFAFLIPDNIEAKKKDPQKESMISMLMQHKKEMFCTIFITSFSAVAFYTLLTFIPYYLNSIGALSLDDTARCTNIANIVMIFSILGAGYLSDKFSRKPFLMVGIIGSCIAFFVMLTAQNQPFYFWMLVNAFCGVSLGVYYSSRSAFFAEAFPKQIRCTAVSISLSLAQAIFGGFSPEITHRLILISPYLSVIPIVVVSILALISLTQLKDRTGEELI